MSSDIEIPIVEGIEPMMEVLNPPIITAPLAAIVSRRFNVHAIVPTPVHNKWNLDFFKVSNNQKIRRYSGGVGAIFIEFVVPDELPVEEQIYFKIQYQSALYSRWARSHNFKIGQVKPAKPVITNPGTVWTPQPEIQGTGGVADATVELYEEGVDTVLFGKASVQSDGSWRTRLTQPLWMGDPFRLTAIQKLNGVVSEWANHVSFAVLFRPVITDVTVSADGKPTVKGVGGLKDASLEIWREGGSGGVQIKATLLSSGNWSVSAAQAWAAGTYRITAKQIGKVTGQSSDWAVVYVFTIKPPAPVIVNPGVVREERPEISGTGGVAGATVRLYKDDVVRNRIGTASVLPDGSWKTKPTYPLQMADPFKLTATQTLDDGESGWASRVEFAVLFRPVIADVALSTDGKPTFRGSGGLAGATLEIWHEGGAGGVLLTTTVQQNGSWLISATTAWSSGHYQITARQIGKVTGQSSDWAVAKAFTVKPPKPAISAPPNPAALKQVLTINGVVSDTVTLKMSTEGGTEIFGTFSSTGITRTFTPTIDWGLGTNTVKVIQTVSGIDSEPSDLCSFSVRPQKPDITTPVENGVINFRSTFSGTNGYAGPGSRVSLQLPGSGHELAYATPNAAGYWVSTFLPHSPGSHEVHVRVDAGPVHSEYVARKFTVRPPLPQITGPTEASGLRPTFIGTGYEGATVNVVQQNYATSVLATATVVNGKWVATLSTGRPDLPVGPYLLSAQQIVEGVPSGWLNPPFEISVQPPKPAITPPSFPAAPKQALTITGVYSTSVTLKMLNDAGGQVAGSFTISGTTGTFMPAQDWAPGANTVKVVQSLGGVDSEASDSCVFSTQPLKLTILPPPGVAGLRQSLIIVGVHSGATGFKMFDGANNEIPGNYTGSGNRRTFMPNQNWMAGNYFVCAVQIVNGVESERSDPCRIVVKPRKLTIIPPTNFIERLQILVITGFDITVAPVAVRVFDALGERVAGIFYPMGTNDSYFAPSKKWPVGATTVTAVQVVDGVESDPSDPCRLVVKPNKLTVTVPTNFVGLRQQLNIGGFDPSVPLMAVRVFDASGERIDGLFYQDHFVPHRNWLVGDNTVVAVQVVDGIESDPSDSCTFKVRPSKPTIIPPPTPVTPQQAMSIIDVHPGATALTMSDGTDRPVSGSFTGNGVTRMFTPAQNWPAGEVTIKAKQSVNDVTSEASDPCTFIAEAVKPQTPIIDFPEQDQIIDLSSNCSGTRGFPEPGAVVSLQEPDTGLEWALAKPTADGRWISSVLPQGPGAHEVHVFVAVGDRYSDPVPLAFKIRPPKPSITPPPTPVDPFQRLTIIGIYSASAILELIDGAGGLVPGTFDGSGKDRVFTPDLAWPLGENSVTVTQTEEGITSVPSDECIFTVVEQEKPDAPVFELPLAGSINPTRPVIQVRGLPDAMITVRLKDDEMLHSASADGNGVLVFSTEERLHPGTNVLEAKQQVSGPESEWSVPHSFTVKAAPQKPRITAPIENSRTSGRFQIRGEGETGGYVQISHADYLDSQIVSIPGKSRWQWQVGTPWEVGHYRIQVRQVGDGDNSEWSGPRAFQVVDTRLLINATGSVNAQPVVSNHESVLLKVQVLDSKSWEGIEGIRVEWRVLKDEDMGVRAITWTDAEGKVEYRFLPRVAGEHQVQADLTSENEGVDLSRVFDVTALEENAWARAFELNLDGEKVDLALSELQLLRGRPYELELKVKSDSPLIGSDVTLEDLADAVDSGLECIPPLGTPQKVEAGAVRWAITSHFGQNSYFGLKLTNPMLPDWWLPGQLLSNDLANDVRVSFDTKYKTPFGKAAFLCHGTRHTLTIKPTYESYLIGKQVTLYWLGESTVDLGVIVEPDPAMPQIMDEVNGVSWTFDTQESLKDGFFAVQLNLMEMNFQSMPLVMSLAHNRIARMEVDTEHEYEGGYRQGVRARSYYTAQPVEGGLVLVEITGREPTIGNTGPDGWFYVQYNKDESAVLTLISPYKDMDQV
ncbi:hypothetical protein [Pseudomonas sp. GL-RE-19]|uniref:hypothetical protein n=1 Tax=Pseudomonas sp. GL-RE-19 TaxID=2832389 RepID=UPI001CBE0443|nr:hypothetical protein [Pseudomonas sp. GL-RE-19]